MSNNKHVDVANPANSKIVIEFMKLLDQIKFDLDNAPTTKDRIGHSFRLSQTKKVIDIIKAYPNKIKEGNDLLNLKGVGKGSVSRINEILDKGYLSEIKVDTQYHKYAKIIDELSQVIGIGRRTAYVLVSKYGVKSVADIKKKHKSGNIKLNDQILMGLKYHGVYKQNIPRAEITEIDSYIHKILVKVDPELNAVICGSYRRLKMVSNDIDILLTHPNVKTIKDMEQKENYLILFVEALRKEGFIVDDLTYEDYTTKYMGFCKYNKYPVRRIDIRYMPIESYYPALVYFTGSGDFNQKIRSLAISLGYKLSEYGLFDEFGNMIPVKSESDLFQKLGLEYISPEKRSG